MRRTEHTPLPEPTPKAESSLNSLRLQIGQNGATKPGHAWNVFAGEGKGRHKSRVFTRLGGMARFWMLEGGGDAGSP
ncbi:hypothetical protein TTMY_1722 [Thermus thermophilus]|nr:hypothetical protein TTMY_1722 [Thermus thermophilus]BDB10359.1 hypothetical protein TthTMY_00980 [Thermus thermophilus]